MTFPLRRLAVAVLSAAVAVAAVPAAAVAGVSAAAAAGVGADATGPDAVPALSRPVGRGALVREAAGTRPPSVKVVDGLVDDWTGTPSRIGGTSRLDGGEHIYSDFLFDDYGADDGYDAERLGRMQALRAADSRFERLDALQQAAGEQFGAARPVGADDHYGDVTGAPDAADLSEVRWALQRGRLHLLARTTTLVDPAHLAVLVLADNGARGGPKPVFFGSGLSADETDVAVLLSRDGGRVKQLQHGTEHALDGDVAVNADGWTNALEASIPVADLVGDDGRLRVAVLAGVLSASGAFTALNAAYRTDEPVTIHNDLRQALALHRREADAFLADIALSDLARGATEQVRPGPGYHERIMRSGENISREAGEHGVLQPYGLYVPRGHDPARATPLTFWLHYRGGKTHSGAAWTPRLVHQLGEDHGNVVVTPRARGTSTWYVTEAHQDFFEVFADVHDLVNVDASRRYLSGYSMGGYGTYLFGLLYPDLFAAGYSTSGAVTQGAWTGLGPDDATCRQPLCFVEANSGDANAQLTYRVLENARHVPLVIHHGSNDELVPISGVQRMGARLAELGYRYDLTMFTGYEHFTQALLDEWADGAAYLNRFRAPTNPRRVTYKVVPALVRAVNTVTADGVSYAFEPDGAYWVDDIRVRGGDAASPATAGTVDVTSHAISEAATAAVPRSGVAALGHSTPFVRHGLDWAALPLPADAARAAFTARLTNVASVTLDGVRMGLCGAETVTAEVTSDGATRVTLVCPDGDVVTAVGAGTEVVTLSLP